MASEITMVELVEALDQELEKLRQDAAGRAQEAAKGAAFVGTAGALGLVSVGALGSLPLLALRRVLPGWQLALIVAGGSAAVAAAFARMGLSRLAAVTPTALEQEAKEAAKNVAASVR